MDLNEGDVRLVRSLVVRHMVELEEELAHADGPALNRALGARLRDLRDLHERLTLNLEPHSRPLPAAARVSGLT